MNKDLGGPAFPNEGGHKFASGNDVRKTLPHPGMTLRDYFAAKAMQSLITVMGTDMADTAMLDAGFVYGETDKFVAKCAYDYADAMLKEHNK
jgi:hypothetical protein